MFRSYANSLTIKNDQPVENDVSFGDQDTEACYRRKLEQ